MTAAARGSPHAEHFELTSASGFTVLHAGHATVTVFALVLIELSAGYDRQYFTKGRTVCLLKSPELTNDEPPLDRSHHGLDDGRLQQPRLLPVGNHHLAERHNLSDLTGHGH